MRVLASQCLLGAFVSASRTSDELELVQTRASEAVAADGGSDPLVDDRYAPGDEAAPASYCESFGTSKFDHGAFVMGLQMAAEKADPLANWTFVQGECQYKFDAYNVGRTRRRYKRSYEMSYPPRTEHQNVPCENVATYCALACQQEPNCMGFSVMLQRTLSEYSWCSIMADTNDDLPMKNLPVYYKGTWNPVTAPEPSRSYPDRNPQAIYTADGESTTFCMGRARKRDPTTAPTGVPTTAPTAAPTDAPTAAPTDAPTAAPTDAPTAAPTDAPTCGVPTAAPTGAPTDAPTPAPTEQPTLAPTPKSPCRPKSWLMCGEEQVYTPDTPLITKKGKQGEQPPITWVNGQKGGELRFTNVGTIDNQAADLIIEPLSTYKGNVDRTGQHGCFGIINVKLESETEFEFRFVKTNTNTPIVADAIYFEWYDFDQNQINEAKEYVDLTATSHSEEHRGKNVGYQGAKYFSKVPGGASDNPTNPYHLTDDVNDKMVRALYQNTASFKATLGAGPGGGKGRNLLFAFNAHWCTDDA